MIFRKKPEAVEASQWFRNGDHPKDDPFRAFEDTGKLPTEMREGNVVRYFRHPKIPGDSICEKCAHVFNLHGFIDNPDVGQVVCPGDWVITSTVTPGYYFPMKPEIFSAVFEPDSPIHHAT